jgi:CTP synthase
MQLAVIEFARHVCGLADAHSSEFNKDTKNPVIFLMKEWYDFQKKSIQRRDEASDLGGTMRLGEYPCDIREKTFAYDAYQQTSIFERHRHRYEFNNEYQAVLEKNGMRVSGICPDANLVEIVEIPKHPWFLGCQFHPEFKSRPMDPQPLFKAFIKASLQRKNML